MDVILTAIADSSDNIEVRSKAIGGLKLPEVRFWFVDKLFATLTSSQRAALQESFEKPSEVTASFIENELCITLHPTYIKMHGFRQGRLDLEALSRRLKRTLETHLAQIIKD